MVDRPIIFSGAMIRALIEGRKSQTRRLAWKPLRLVGDGGFGRVGPMQKPSPWQRVQPGDRLWVRENWRAAARCDDERPLSIGAVEYDASERQFPEMPAGKLRPSIHMPRWASRLTLTVTAVKVERLQNISEADAIAEGVEPPETERECHDWSICQKCGGTGTHGALGEHMGVIEVDCSECDTACRRFRNLWNGLHGPEAWDANPEVVAISFTVERRNIDAR